MVCNLEKSVKCFDRGNNFWRLSYRKCCDWLSFLGVTGAVWIINMANKLQSILFFVWDITSRFVEYMKCSSTFAVGNGKMCQNDPWNK